MRQRIFKKPCASPGDGGDDGGKKTKKQCICVKKSQNKWINHREGEIAKRAKVFKKTDYLSVFEKEEENYNCCSLNAAVKKLFMFKYFATRIKTAKNVLFFFLSKRNLLKLFTCFPP